MKRKDFPFWIKERNNPQLGVYYVAMGQMSKTAAKRAEGSLYGNNVMRAFDSEEIYKDTLTMLRAKGETVQ